jgi:hypothetical protein
MDAPHRSAIHPSPSQSCFSVFVDWQQANRHWPRMVLGTWLMDSLFRICSDPCILFLFSVFCFPAPPSQ